MRSSQINSTQRETESVQSLWQIRLLICANFLTSIGGGSVLSAAKGVSSLTIFGSGSIFAFLTGSALSLGMLIIIKSYSHIRMLVRISILTILSSIILLNIVWSSISVTEKSISLSGTMAWIFFIVLVIRYAFWFLSRSLRSNVASMIKSSYLALTEAFYFLGFIIGLLLKPTALMADGSIIKVLIFDITLLVVVAACDFFQQRYNCCSSEQYSYISKNRIIRKPFFLYLTGALGFLTIACQVVVFHFADSLAQSDMSTLGVLTDVLLAVFYIGIATMATLCFWWKPSLEIIDNKASRVSFHLNGRIASIPFSLLVLSSSLMIFLGIIGIADIVNLKNASALYMRIRMISFLTIGIGAGLFEFLFLSIIGRISSLGNSMVALAIGIVSMGAAVSMFLMLQWRMYLIGRLVVVIIGASLSVLLVKWAKSYKKESYEGRICKNKNY